MKKHIETGLFAVAAIAMLVTGCTTPLIDQNGKPVCGPDGKPVTVSDSEMKRVETSIPNVRIAVRKALDEEAKTNSNVDKVSLSDARLAALAGGSLDPESLKVLRAVAHDAAEKHRRQVIYPNKAKAIIEKILPRYEKYMAQKEFEKARELLWSAPTTGVAPIDEIVRTFALEKMRTEVNPAEWALVAKELKSRTAALAKTKKFEQAIAWVKSYRRVRTYSKKLDEKLGTVKDELVRLGVDEENLPPILAATGELVGQAAKIADMTDVTTNAVKVIPGATHEGTTVDLTEYRKKLDAFRKLLVRFDCTEAAADEIAESFDADVAPLLKPLSREASKDPDRKETTAFLQLGTGALNARIDELVENLVADLARQDEEYRAELRAAAIREAIDRLREKVEALVAAGEFAQAREEIWTACSTEDADWNAKLREVGSDLMLRLVNPSNWTAIEAEFAAKSEEAKENASYDEAIAWAEAYPDVRTFTEAVDGKLLGVKEELEGFGLDGDKLQAAVDETLKAGVEVARLANHVDTVETKVGDDAEFDLARYGELLGEYRATLVRNDCTEEGADRLVAFFKEKVAPLIALASAGEERKNLVLGCNAINDRLAKLRATTVDALKSAKYRWVFTDLIARTTAAVAEGRYGDARDVVRDVPLVQDAEWDAKIYATRIGLLNSVVNPNQCAALLEEIDRIAKELFEAKKYEEFREYARNFPFVHDTYRQILDALEQTKEAMIGLTIAEEDAGAYIDALAARIAEMMEKRPGAYAPEADYDLEELEKALAALEEGIVAQYYRREEVAAFCRTLKEEIVAMLSKTPDPLTTWEMNARLAARLGEYDSKVDALVAERDEAAAYAKLLAEVDREVSFDSQIAMAEEAIAKQLGGGNDPASGLKVNALLGEYARAMRLLKLGRKLDADLATVMLLGGVYLDQGAVAERALQLGANVNGVSSRDPMARTPLLLAIQMGNAAMLKRLSDAGASATASDADGDTALHYAVRRGDLSIVRAMLVKNRVDAVNKARETPIFIAARRNQAAIAAALVAAKANVAAANAKGETAMDAACLAGSRDVLDVLAEAGAKYGPAQLALAAKMDHLAVAQWLVGKGVDVNAPGVMAACVRKSATKRYLVWEGGLPVASDDDEEDYTRDPKYK